MVTAPVVAGPPLNADEMRAVSRETIFSCCKWDVQVGDAAALCRFPLLVSPEMWDHLARLAEALDRETLAAELEIVECSIGHNTLGLPRRVRRVLRGVRGKAPVSDIRVARYDFHPTDDGWAVSEVNSDVPGGYIEASGFTSLMSARAGLPPVGDPAGALARELAARTPLGGRIALVHATAYTDDRQVVEYLARRLRGLDRVGIPAAPDHVLWGAGPRPTLVSDGRAIDAIFRFFPGEWLVNLRGRDWRAFFDPPWGLPVCNPATAMVTQSKRFPLVWSRLRTPVPTWASLLPQTRAPEDAPWRNDGDWVLKPALGRVGDGVTIRGVTDQKRRAAAERRARWFPGRWIAQRRFAATAIDSPDGPIYPCIGVYVICGAAAGAYARVSGRPLIDDRAQDAAVLIAASAPRREVQLKGGLLDTAAVL